MRLKIWILVVALLAIASGPASAQKNKIETKSFDARGTVTSTNWAIDYPDFALALQEEKWSWILKPLAGNTIGSGDSAEFILTDASGKEVLSDSGYSSGVNGTIEFSGYVSGSDFAGIDLTRPFKGIIKVTRGYDSSLKDAVVSVTIPVTGFPKRPSTSKEYLTLNSSFSSIPFPQNCTPTEFQFTINDPYSEISTVTFTVTDAKGKEVATSFAYGIEDGLQKEDIRLCSYSLEGTVAPYSFVTKISFESNTGKLALTETIAFPLASKKDEAIAKANTLGEFCAKGTASKVVSSGTSCPSGYKKINFVVPDEIAWNSLTRVPNSQKNKNYTIYACVAQFDANTGGSKFRGYASPVQLEYYFSGGVNAIFTGSAKQLLKLSADTAFIAKVTVTGGVTYTTIGGRTTVPSLAIRQFQSVGSC